MEKIKVDTEVFEGPIDLLLYLVKKREVSIYEISISEITEEFLNYIYSMQELNIPLASEFIYMAAVLTKIKSENLIPSEEEEKPKNQLVQLIEKYLQAKKGAKLLEKLEEEAAKCFCHDPSELLFQFQDKIKIANTKEDLKLAYERVLNKKEEKTFKIGLKISSETFKVSEKVEELRSLFKENYLVPFSNLVQKSSCKLELIVYFLAVLELCKLGEVATFTDGRELFVTKVFPLSKERREIVVKESAYAL